MKKILLFAFIALLCNYAFAQTTKRPFAPSDLNLIPTLSNPALSPDGKWIVYELAEVDTAKNKSVTHLWMQSWDGTESIELTHGAEFTSAPKWSPDNNIVFFIGKGINKRFTGLADGQAGYEGKKLTDIKGELAITPGRLMVSKLVLAIKEPGKWWQNVAKPRRL